MRAAGEEICALASVVQVRRIAYQPELLCAIMKNKSTKRSASSVTQTESGPVTLERVAKEAGVSPATVSRILNGTAVVSDERKTAVELAIAKLGLFPTRWRVGWPVEKP